ncbi:MAG TPA: DUF63 family protein [Natrialbaceae archaeon]|nr:DUF63 family protein [Natrialbaceae archaeon]
MYQPGWFLFEVLPSNFSLPDPIYLIPLVVLTIGVVALAVVVNAPVTDEAVVAFAPWMALGAIFHVLYQQGAFPESIDPLFGAPSVYMTTFVIAGLAWFLSTLLAETRANASVERQLGTIGLGFAVVFAGFSLYIGADRGRLTPESAFWPLIGLVVAGVVAVLAWVLLSLTFTDAARRTGMPGSLVVFAHTLDGVSTAIGVDVLGVTERTPLSKEIMDFAASLPTESTLGSGWLFVAVKVALALVVIAAVEGLYEDEPLQARVLLGFVAAVGFGPGIHNLLLFAVSG